MRPRTRPEVPTLILAADPDRIDRSTELGCRYGLVDQLRGRVEHEARTLIGWSQSLWVGPRALR